MRRLIATFAAALSLAAVPAFALADGPRTSHDCLTKCDCSHGASTSPEATTGQPSEYTKWVWSSI